MEDCVPNPLATCISVPGVTYKKHNTFEFITRNWKYFIKKVKDQVQNSSENNEKETGRNFLKRAIWSCAIYAAVSGLWIYASDKLLILFTSDPDAIRMISTWKGFFFIAVTSLMLFVLIRHIHVQPLKADFRNAEKKEPDSSPPRPNPFVYLASFILFTIALLFIVFLVFNRYEKQNLLAAETQLRTVTGLKTLEIGDWLEERLNDAKAMTGNKVFVDRVARWISGDTAEYDVRRSIEERFNILLSLKDYSALCLFDKEGRPLVSAGGPAPSKRQILSLLKESTSSVKVILIDINPRETGSVTQPELGVSVPLFTRAGNSKEKIGLIYMRIDPALKLYPLVRTRPGMFSSLESYMVRRDGDQEVYLGELRYRKSTSPAIGAPVSASRLPAAITATGMTGFIEGADYRGVPCFSYVEPVKGTRWLFVTKVDRAEILAPIEHLKSLAAILVVIFTIILGTIIYLWWRHQNARILAAYFRTELEHRSLVARFDAFSRHANDSIFLFDEEGRIIDANERAAKTYGYPLGHLIGMSVRDLRAPETLKDLDCHWQRSMTDEGVIFETIHRRADGCVFPVEVSARLITLEGRKYRESIVRDISERKHLEEQLIHVQKMEAIGTLAGGVAHDFNNILTSIVGYGGLLQMKIGAEDPMRKSVDGILSAADRAVALTQGLLAYSRKGAINVCPVDLNDIITRADQLLSRIIGEDIELAVFISDTPLTILGDAAQMERVIVNLSTNARDSMPKGGSLIIRANEVELDKKFVSIHGYGKPGRYALLTVADTGSGMDKATMERIFEPFYTTKEVGKGTGLGLSIVYGIVKQHGGFVEVESKMGTGTMFLTYFPLADPSPEGERREALIRPHGGNETILLVEDNEHIRSFLRDLLSENGYRVIEGVDGEDGIRKFREHDSDIDLLVLDVIMPKNNGPGVYDEIRRTRDVKAMFMSGYTVDVISRRGVDTEKFEVISKPVSPHAFLSKVREVLDKRA